MDQFNKLVWYITNRDDPWTDDPILLNYRFANNRRMDDKTSKWLINYWYGPRVDHKNMLVACTIGRFINKIETLELIGFPFQTWGVFKKQAKHRVKDRTKLFSNIRMMRGIQGWTKFDLLLDVVCNPLMNNPPHLNTESMATCHKELMGYWGFSSFSAGQVVADLRHGLTGSWKDKKTWAPMSKEPVEALNRIYGNPLTAKCDEEKFLSRLNGVKKKLSAYLTPRKKRQYEAVDYAHILGQFNRYMKIENEELIGKVMVQFRNAGPDRELTEYQHEILKVLKSGRAMTTTEIKDRTTRSSSLSVALGNQSGKPDQSLVARGLVDQLVPEEGEKVFRFVISSQGKRMIGGKR